MSRTTTTTAAVFARVLFATALLSGVQVAAAEWLVKYKTGRVNSSFSAMNASVRDHNARGKLTLIDLAGQDEIATVARLMKNPDVEYVVPNMRVYAFKAALESPLELQKQWSIAKVEAEKAWARLGHKGSKRVTVAVIDTGVDSVHSNLQSNMVKGYDFIKNTEKQEDITSSKNPGHGTHCAGIMGSDGTVDGGVIGISPQMSIMPLRFLDENGSGDLNNAIKAIDFAISKKVDIISASWGAAAPRSAAQPLIEAVQRAEKAGILFVAAASNDGKNNDAFEVYPANAGVNNMITVSASGDSDNKPSWSNYGKSSVDIASPGEKILSTLPGGKWGVLSGTSMATPMVAGFAALIKSAEPNLQPHEIRSLMQASADKVGIETACDCRINAATAVDTIMDKKMVVVPFATTIDPQETVQFSALYAKAPLKFAVSNSAAGSIDANGLFTAKAIGETQVTVTDATGKVASNYRLIVGRPQRGGGGGGDCPLGDPMICLIACMFEPSLPWCEGSSGGENGFPFPLPFSARTEQNMNRSGEAL